MIGEKLLTEIIARDLSPETKTALWRFLLTGAVLTHIAMACGIVPGVQGFAWAGDVSNNTQTLASLEKKVDCNSINSEISLLRSERRAASTDLFEAQQANNTDLVQFINGTIADIQEEIDDQLEKRRTAQCP